MDHRCSLTVARGCPTHSPPRSASHVDAQIGAILHALDVLELRSSTSVILQGDHGFSLGRHGRWSKYNLYDDAVRVPLVFSVVHDATTCRSRIALPSRLPLC